MAHDVDSIIHAFIKRKLEQGEIIIIDKVLQECGYFQQGLVLKNIDYLRDESYLKNAGFIHKTDGLLAPDHRKFLEMVNNEFKNKGYINSKKLTPTDIEAQKKKFLDGADVAQIILCLNLKQSNDICLITEESGQANDLKCFHKIPTICDYLDIKTHPIPWLITHYGINVKYQEQIRATI